MIMLIKIKIKKILFHNQTNQTLPKNFNKYIEYNVKQPYMERIYNLTNYIEEDYFCFSA